MKSARLTPEEIEAIIETAKEVFENDVKVWLFGSRIDLAKRGGDIDLYIETPFKGDIQQKLRVLDCFKNL